MCHKATAGMKRRSLRFGESPLCGESAPRVTAPLSLHYDVLLTTCREGANTRGSGHARKEHKRE
jgi:hypothetical protein